MLIGNHKTNPTAKFLNNILYSLYGQTNWGTEANPASFTFDFSSDVRRILLTSLNNRLLLSSERTEY